MFYDTDPVVTTLACLLAFTIMALAVLAHDNKELSETNKILQKRIMRYKRREERRGNTKDAKSNWA